MYTNIVLLSKHNLVYCLYFHHSVSIFDLVLSCVVGPRVGGNFVFHFLVAYGGQTFIPILSMV